MRQPRPQSRRHPLQRAQNFLPPPPVRDQNGGRVETVGGLLQLLAQPLRDFIHRAVDSRPIALRDKNGGRLDRHPVHLTPLSEPVWTPAPASPWCGPALETAYPRLRFSKLRR